MTGLEICLMGTIDARRAGTSYRLPGRRVRALLALLALSAGRTVSVDRLATGIWDDDPPDRVRGSLQTYVARLRGVLGSETVETTSVGYRLRVEPRAVDLLDFHQHLERAARCADPAAERGLLDEALARWRDAPFGEAPSDWLARYEQPLWVERHLRALERRVDLDLAAGAHAACALELAEHATHHPLRESLWLRWLLALHGSGRTAEALTRYEELRRALADELGTDPGADLQRLHQRLLAGDPVAEHDRVAARAAVPRQLPTDVVGFAGRATQLADLDRLTGVGADDGSAGEPAALLVLHGAAGTGKTTLAVHWAHRRRAGFPDGELFVDLRGYGPGAPLDTTEALGQLLLALGEPRSTLPDDALGRAAAWRSLLADRRMLVVLDDAHDSEQVRQLLPGGPSTVVVTSRSQLRSLAAREGARRLLVDPMTAEESVSLLTGRLAGLSWTGEAPPATAELSELAELCGHLPLALAVAAEGAGRTGRADLGGAIERLRDRRSRLSELTAWHDDPTTSLRVVLDWSYRALGPDSARMLRMVGLVPAPRMSTESMAALAAVDTALADQLLDRLSDGHLVRAVRPGWWEVHELVRTYAEERLERTESAGEREAAVRRLRSWYSHTAERAVDSVGSRHPHVVLGEPEPGVAPQRFTDSAGAFDWFRSHRRGLTTLVEQAAEDGDHQTVTTLVPLLSVFLGTGGGLREEVRLHSLAEASAAAAGDDLARAICATHLGMSYGRAQHHEDARAWFDRARTFFAAVGNRPGELHMMMTLGVVLTSLGDLDAAAALLEEVQADAQRLGLEAREAAATNNLAVAYTRMGRGPEAIENAGRAVAMHLRLGNPLNAAMAWDTLGSAHLEHGAPTEAHTAYQGALAIHRELGESVSHATTLKNRGRAEQALGRTGRARGDWEEALAMLDRVDGVDSIDVSRREIRALLGE